MHARYLTSFVSKGLSGTNVSGIGIGKYAILMALRPGAWAKIAFSRPKEVVARAGRPVNWHTREACFQACHQALSCTLLTVTSRALRVSARA